jgi:hypothetical protein
MKYHLKVTFTEPMLASSPADPEVYKQFIEARKRKEQDEARTVAAQAGGVAVEDAIATDEVGTLDAGAREQTGWSVFHKDDTGIFIFDYKVRGFMKEACSAVTGKTELSAYKSKIDKWLFVLPRRIYLRTPDNQLINEPHGTLERPLRAMTMQGPRVSVKRSDYLNPGTWFECELVVLPNGEKELKEQHIRNWFSYGVWQGFGEWRNGSYGRFEYELTAK